MPADSNPAALPEPGQLIGERYRLEQRLSDGVQGSLWRARDAMASSQSIWACKK